MSENTAIHSLRNKLYQQLATIGEVGGFIARVFQQAFGRFEWNEWLKQCYQIGYRSLGLVGITGLIIGLVLTIQSRPVLVDFGAESMLPGMVSVSLIREMGPVITALLCAGKIGSSIGAELGSMRVTEQIDAMEVSAANPIRFLVIPRVAATTLMLPILTIYADALGLIGGWIGANLKGDFSLRLYFTQAFLSLDFSDIFPSVLKTFFFGLAIGLVGCYKGYNAGRGTESVGVAANSAVVLSSLFVIILDLLAAQLTDLFA